MNDLKLIKKCVVIQKTSIVPTPLKIPVSTQTCPFTPHSPFKIPNDPPQGGHGYFCGNHTIQDLQYSKGFVTKFLKTTQFPLRYRLSQA